MSCERRELRRSASSIATELWSPDELYKADPQGDILQPILKTIDVESGWFYGFRLSLLLAPFEALERYQVPQSENNYSLVNDGVFEVTCTEMRWDGRPDASTMGIIAEQCKSTQWLRFSSTLSGRLFVVDRSVAHVQTLVSALRYSFSHLFFPVDLEMCERTCSVLFEFIVHHWSRLSGFLPLLYFVFEMQERAFLSFYKHLANVIQIRMNNDVAACDALKPKKSGKMFSWFSSKPKEAELGVNDKLEIIDNLKGMLPPNFEKRYMLALVNHEHFGKMQLFCREYMGSLMTETSTYQTLAEGFATYPLHSSPVKGWYQTSALEALTKENTAASKVATSVQRFALRKGSLVRELVVPYLKAVSQCEWEIGVIAQSLVAFYEALMMRAKRVKENTMLLTGEVPMPPGCEASMQTESLKYVRVVNERFRLELASANEQFDAEVAYAEAAIKTRMRRLCILLGGVVKAVVCCTSAEYYEEYLLSPTLPKSDDVTKDCFRSHPPKECLGVKEGQEESIYTIDREGV
ncbi:hypothetical protein, conserved [Leishmania tarentolae]|uniref:Uncharacterized protein n=1 Tax=Leishmania tarentolae TaxID=5689 RepID=A0A640KKC0_LEITA|nr:hypothetical protein, conserved [Leishmania tarentolae]